MSPERHINPDPAQLCQDCDRYPCDCDLLAPAMGFWFAVFVVVCVGLLTAAILLLPSWIAAQSVNNIDLSQAFIGAAG